MGYHSDYVSGACDICRRARESKSGWYCSCNEDGYFPDAPFDGPDEYEPTTCPSFKLDPNCVD